jgi:hypothetical protein
MVHIKMAPITTSLGDLEKILAWHEHVKMAIFLQRIGIPQYFMIYLGNKSRSAGYTWYLMFGVCRDHHEQKVGLLRQVWPRKMHTLNRT